MRSRGFSPAGTLPTGVGPIGANSIPLNVYGDRLSRNLAARRGIRTLRSAKTTEILMDIIAILEIGATAALLVGHLVIVVRNRFADRT